ncbi:unnamed protein product [Notodromas monacha]|uniref:Uncharacterized protein n=1 Tax=Notodromas monacha TaxID=399045 RepID=A0A7R9BNC5_9CRUS|nr:unnamed protein product [Notodromas monacha]CAG0918689.1 unnamed protein product [Notodromas monacha]
MTGSFAESRRGGSVTLARMVVETRYQVESLTLRRWSIPPALISVAAIRSANYPHISIQQDGQRRRGKCCRRLVTITNVVTVDYQATEYKHQSQSRNHPKFLVSLLLLTSDAAA